MYNAMVSAQDPAVRKGQTIPPVATPSIDQVNSTPVAEPPVKETPAAPARRESPFVALRYRDFRLIWSGTFVSQLGSQMRIVAVTVQLWDLTQSYSAVGLLGLFRLLPLLVFALFGGVIADAVDRRKLLLITQATMALTSVILAVSTQFGWMSAPLIYGISALGAVALAFDNPARSALTPNLVPRQHLPTALSLNIIVMQVATIVGPMVGGQFLALHNTGFVIIYWIDAVSFTAVMIALLFMRTKIQGSVTRDVSVRAALDGLRFLKKTPILMSTMTLDFFATFFGAASLLLPAFAEKVLHIERDALIFPFVTAWGLLYAAPAIGAVVAGLIMSWFGNVRHQGWIVILSVVAYGISTVVFGFSTMFWLTVIGLAGTGAADTVSMVMRQTIRQMSTPDELRGRMTSVNMLFYMGGPQLGEFEAGIAAAALGLGPSIVLGGISVIVVTAITGWLVPSLKNYDRSEPQEVH